MSNGIRYQYLDHLVIDKNIKWSDRKTQVKQIKDKFCHGTIRIKKLRSCSSNLFSMRLNDKARAICKIIKDSDKKICLKIAHIFLKHDQYIQFLKQHDGSNNYDVETIADNAVETINDVSSTEGNLSGNLHKMGIAHVGKEIMILDSEQLKVLDATKNTSGTAAFKVIGPPGSGKTLVAEVLMNEYSTSKGLYLTKSEELIDNVTKYAKDQWSCKTFKDFCSTLVNRQIICDRTNFIRYILDNQEFKKRLADNKFSKEYYAKMLYESICKINDYINDGCKPESIGKKQSNDDNLESSKEILRLYQGYLGTEKIDLSLMKIDKNNLSHHEEEKYDYIIIDEAQNFCKSELRYVQSFLKQHGKICFFMDPNQSIYSDINLTSQYINELSKERDCTLTTYNFINGYRTSQTVNEATNRMLCAKRNIVGGEFSKDAPKDIESASCITGCIIWIQEDEEILKNLQDESQTHKNNKVALAVIIPHPDYREKAQELFPNRLILTAEGASGLEFQKVVLYNFFSGNYKFNFMNQIKRKNNDETYKKIHEAFSTDKSKNNCPKSINDAKENLSCNEFFNKTVVAMTRSVSDLYVIETQETSGSELLRQEFEKISSYYKGQETGLGANLAGEKDAIDMILWLSDDNLDIKNFLELCAEIDISQIDQERKPKLVARLDERIKKLKEENNKDAIEELAQYLVQLNGICEDKDRLDVSRIPSTSSTASISSETQQKSNISDTEKNNRNNSASSSIKNKNNNGSANSPIKNENRKKSTKNEQTTSPAKPKREMTTRNIISYGIDTFTAEELAQPCADGKQGCTVLSVLLHAMPIKIRNFQENLADSILKFDHNMLNAIDSGGKSLAYFVVTHDKKLSLEALQTLINKVSDKALNAIDSEGVSTLYYLIKDHIAPRTLRSDILQTLINKVTAKELCTIGPCGWSPMHYLYSSIRESCVLLLDNKLNKYIDTLAEELIDNIKVAPGEKIPKTEEVKTVISQGLKASKYKDLCSYVEYDTTALHSIAVCATLQSNKTKCYGLSKINKIYHELYIEFLLKHGADVNAVTAKSQKNCTALCIAAQCNLVWMVKPLLRHEKIDVNALCDEESALGLAASYGCVEVVKLLLAHPEINVNICHAQGTTPLYGAVQYKQEEIVKLLLSHKEIEVNTYCLGSFAPLHIAIASKNVEIVNDLLSHGANVYVQDEYNRNSMRYAIQGLQESKYYEDIEHLLQIIKLLLENKATIDLTYLNNNVGNMDNNTLKLLFNVLKQTEVKGGSDNHTQAVQLITNHLDRSISKSGQPSSSIAECTVASNTMLDVYCPKAIHMG